MSMDTFPFAWCGDDNVQWCLVQRNLQAACPGVLVERQRAVPQRLSQRLEDGGQV